MKRLLIPFIALALCPPAQAFWGKQQATSWPPKSLNDDPDVQVPFFTSIEESCAHFHAIDRTNDVVQARTKPVIDSAMNDVRAGLLDPKGFNERTLFARRQQRDSEQRLTAAVVGVLRVLKYPDWQKYSRYSFDGAGDLWNSQIIAGDKVANNEKHPDYKFTFMGGWRSDVRAACKPYKKS